MANGLDFNAIKKNLQQHKDNINNEVEQFKKLIDDYIDNNEDEIIEKLQEAFNTTALRHGTTSIEVNVTYNNNFDRACPNSCEIKFDRDVIVKEFKDCTIPRGKEEECISYALEKLISKLRIVPFTGDTSKKIIKPNISKPTVRDSMSGTFTYGYFNVSIDIERL